MNDRSGHGTNYERHMRLKMVQWFCLKSERLCTSCARVSRTQHEKMVQVNQSNILH